MLPNRHERPVKCTLCDATFSTEVELQVHLLSATFDMPFPHIPVPKCRGRNAFVVTKGCSKCTKTFPNQTALELHMVLYGPQHDDTTTAAATLPELWSRHQLPNQDLIDSIGHLEMFDVVGACIVERVMIVIKNRRRAAQVVHKMVDDWCHRDTKDFMLEKIRMYPFGRDQLPVDRAPKRAREDEAGPSGSTSVTEPYGTAGNRKLTPILEQEPPPYQSREGSPMDEDNVSASVFAPTSTSHQAEGQRQLFQDMSPEREAARAPQSSQEQQPAPNDDDQHDGFTPSPSKRRRE